MLFNIVYLKYKRISGIRDRRSRRIGLIKGPGIGKRHQEGDYDQCLVGCVHVFVITAVSQSRLLVLLLNTCTAELGYKPRLATVRNRQSIKERACTKTNTERCMSI